MFSCTGQTHHGWLAADMGCFSAHVLVASNLNLSPFNRVLVLRVDHSDLGFRIVVLSID